MNVVHEDVKQCVENELQHAVSVFGLHHSNHEKMAVIFEEYEECTEAVEDMRQMMQMAWGRTRDNMDGYMMDDAYGRIYDAAVRTAIEAIQVAAMAMKEIGTDKPKATKDADTDHPFTKTCSVCGSKVDKDDRFCYECGAKLGE